MAIHFYVSRMCFYFLIYKGGWANLIIWIDGTYGVGKTAVAMKMKESFPDNNVELLEADYYCNETLKRLVEEAQAKNCMPYIGGTLPQNNMYFIKEFKELIEEKSQNDDINLIVDMALTMTECKEGLYDCLKRDGKNIVHIILTADADIIKSRIKNDENRMKETAMEWLTWNIAFLDKNFSDAIWIRTDDRDVDDIVTEAMRVILC